MITLAINQGQRPPRRRKSQFETVLGVCEAVVAFIGGHAPPGCQAYLAVGPGNVGLYLLTTSQVYDFDLSDKLADFAAPYIARGLLTSVMLLPASTPEELTAYFDPAKAIRLAGTE